ncbi:chromatin remodelling complex Rsc7/Swp82 subunit-domain-containing protein [Gaertneriomyces semiglobifer]|nr:chromatin remodelling complex Rsc7/Swp82 subunit-domain-containing protein [Gaertneriomyces semiglobifer]
MTPTKKGRKGMDDENDSPLKNKRITQLQNTDDANEVDSISGDDVEKQEDDEDDGNDSDFGGSRSRKASVDQPVKRRGRPRGPGTPDARVDVYGVKDISEEDVEKDWDEKGEQKITKDGELLGGREYRLKAFRLPRHPSRLYMLTADIAKALQYRDTYIFFLKNPHITRIQGTSHDKKFLEDNGMLPGQLRRRPVSLATARSIFRAFGHKAVRRGKPVRDDYWVGDQIEPPDDPNEPDEEEEEEIFHRMTTRQKAKPPVSVIPEILPRRHITRVELGEEAKIPLSLIPASVSGDDFMVKRAHSAAEFNRRLILMRQRTFFDHHTNMDQVPNITQPSHVYVQLRRRTMHLPLEAEPATVVQPSAIADDSWVAVEPTPEEERYPIAVMPGQYQGLHPIHSYRFGEEPKQSSVERDGHSFVDDSLSTPVLSPRTAQQPAARIKHLDYVCGTITRTGLGCKRPVYSAGDKCLYHAKSIG